MRKKDYGVVNGDMMWPTPLRREQICVSSCKSHLVVRCRRFRSSEKVTDETAAAILRAEGVILDVLLRNNGR
jgi:hypothetical protein